MRLLFLLFLLTLNCYSQSIVIEDQVKLKTISIDSVNNIALLFYQNNYDKINLETFEKKSYKFYADSTFNITKFTPQTISGITYFVSVHGGMVYKMQNDTIKRIDRSFDHRMQYSANLFTHNSKLYKYGGYGFWSARNFFTYFDDNSKEWEAIDHIYSKSIPKGSFGDFYIKNNNAVYLFGGKRVDPFNNREVIYNDAVWQFDFNNNKWKYLGKSTLTNQNNTIYTIHYKNKLLISTQNNLILIDAVNNKLITYDHSTLSSRVSEDSKSFFLNGKFYCLIKERGKLHFQAINEKYFFGNQLSHRVFYKNYTYWFSLLMFYLLIPLIILLIFSLFIKNYRKYKKIVLLDNGLKFKNKFIEFEKDSMAIIKLLLSEKEVNSSKILKLVEKKHFSPAHNERIKVQKIKDINLKVKTLLGINREMIKETKSENDRRVRIYTISKEYFIINTDVLK